MSLDALYDKKNRYYEEKNDLLREIRRIAAIRRNLADLLNASTSPSPSMRAERDRWRQERRNLKDELDDLSFKLEIVNNILDDVKRDIDAEKSMRRGRY